jgi:hypothetical protein
MIGFVVVGGEEKIRSVFERLSKGREKKSTLQSLPANYELTCR